MIRLLLTALFFSQGIPVLPSDSGTVTGVLRTPAGTPAVGVRVAAVAQPDTPQDALSASAMAGLTQTDSSGHFQLENIPPGRYYIAAGRLDLPTYYPGAVEMSGGKAVVITRGLMLSGIDFEMKEISGAAYVQADTLSIPVNVRVEGGGKVPVFSSAGFATLRLTQRSDGRQIDFPIAPPAITVNRATNSYIVRVENLPSAYTVTSIRSGSTDLQREALSIPLSAFQVRASGIAATLPVGIDITLSAPAAPPKTEAHVTGKMKSTEGRSVYLSGQPGVLYSDGTFEFEGVTPGRHIVATLDKPLSSRPFGAAITVGQGNLENIELVEVPLLPNRVESRLAPAARNLVNPMPLPALRGRVVDEVSREPFNAGSVTLTGDTVADYKLDEDGRFEILRLLPGSL